jgi:MYXO-CTERM domain-containing protein
MRIKTIVGPFALLSALTTAAALAGPTTIASPTALDGNLDSPLTIGDVTLSGGQLLFDQWSPALPQQTGVYASSSDFGGYTNPILIDFATAPTGNVQVVTWNRSTVPKTQYINGVSHNPNGVKFVNAVQIDTDTFAAYFNSGVGTVADDIGATWNFGVVGYRIGSGPAVYFSAAAIPEPASAGLGVLGLGGLALLRRR